MKFSNFLPSPSDQTFDRYHAELMMISNFQSTCCSTLLHTDFYSVLYSSSSNCNNVHKVENETCTILKKTEIIFSFSRPSTNIFFSLSPITSFNLVQAAKYNKIEALLPISFYLFILHLIIDKIARAK